MVFRSFYQILIFFIFFYKRLDLIDYDRLYFEDYIGNFNYVFNIVVNEFGILKILDVEGLIILL